MSRTAKALLQDAPALRPDTTGAQVYDLFSEDRDLLVCAVVEDGEPIGLVSRNAFFLRMADTHGRALFAKRPITFVMNTDPLVVELDRPISDVNRMIVTDRPSALFDGFILTDHGRYVGVGTGVGLMKVLHQESGERNRKLVALAEQLGRTRIEALSAAQAKSEFLATMSHEIRTPLNGVLGVAQLLMESGLDPERLKLAETIRSSGEILLRLLNDILDLSKIESGKMDLEEIGFDPDEIVTACRGLWAPRAEAKGVRLSVSGPRPGARRLNGDPTRLKQILFNLVGNAIKFTDEGSVTVSLSCVDIAPMRTVLRAEIVDTGCGVPESARPRLFKSFTQADGATSRRFGGTGLGLTICKSLTDMMGGTIGFDSVEGEGSTFWFEIPLQTALEAAPAEGSAPALPAAEAGAEAIAEADEPAPRILLAEDNPINQDVVRGFLKLRGWSCEVVEDGAAAVEAVAARTYDLVLMDLQMPGMDGLEATRRIRALDGAAASTPIVALTANAMRGDEARCLAAGMDGYASKPIVKAAFFAAMDAALAGGTTQSERRAGAA